MKIMLSAGFEMRFNQSIGRRQHGKRDRQ